METLTLSTEVLDWAAEHVGKSYPALVEGMARRPRDRELLLDGQLTSAQAEKVAKLTGVPFGLLFLSSPPALRRPAIPDLRQTTDPAPLSDDFQQVYEDALAKQQWYLNLLQEQGALPLPFVGKFGDRARPEQVAQDIVSTLYVSPAARKGCANAEEYFTLLADRAEDAGVLVMKSGIVKSNTRRPLSVKEFRGFAVADKLAPLVFINGRDFEVAAVFTLIHELAHVWTGHSGVSDLSAPSSDHRHIERLCNQVAGEVLVPRDEFLTQWKARSADLAGLATFFRVSRLVVARRALDFKLINQQEYDHVAAQSRTAIPKGSGGDAYRTIPVRNSKRLTATLVRSVMAGETLIRDAANLLNVKPGTVVQLGRRGNLGG